MSAKSPIKKESITWPKFLAICITLYGPMVIGIFNLIVLTSWWASCNDISFLQIQQIPPFPNFLSGFANLMPPDIAHELLFVEMVSCR